METRAHYVAVGTFVLAIIFLAFVAVLWLARVEFARVSSDYDIYFSGSVTGLNEGAAVLYNGVRVGRVAEIRLDPANIEQIRVTAEIDNSAVIKADAVAVLDTNLLSGVSFIQIRGGTRDAPILKRQEGQRYPVIASERSTLERVYSRAPRLLERLIDVADDLNALLNDQNRQAIADSLQDLRVTTAAIADRSKEMSQVITNANETLLELRSLVRGIDQSYAGRDGLKDQLSQMLNDYDRLAKSLVDTSRQLQLVVQESRPGLREFGQRTLTQLGDLVGDMQRLVASWSRVASQIERDPQRLLLGERREGYRP